MATSTPNKGFIVPTVGADRNQWGTQWNSNINYLDKALGGVLNPVNVAGSGDFTVTAADAQNVAHVLTGVLTGTRNYILPAGAHGFWFISNTTTGNFSLYVRSAGGGLNLEILQGNAVVLWSDGVSIVPAVGSQLAKLFTAAATAGKQAVNYEQFATVSASNWKVVLPGNLKIIGGVAQATAASVNWNYWEAFPSTPYAVMLTPSFGNGSVAANEYAPGRTATFFQMFVSATFGMVYGPAATVNYIAVGPNT